ncbi:MAG: ribosome small subunit-dependent GTPase A [Bacteroidales bacterium]|nr:ribosome small subunit-dependent GTPase A [Bacteroidales bacterium]
MGKGIVIKTTGSWHTVKSGKEQINCRLKGTFRTRGMKNTNPIAVGDQVDFEITDNLYGAITKIHDRRNYIIRKAINLSKEVQILAANIDQAVLMFTLDYPETPLEFVDRFLLSAEAYHIECVLLINKIDLYQEHLQYRLQEVHDIYEYAGYKVIDISVETGLNMTRVDDILTNKLTLISGNSGVGKSSLINRLCPGLHLKTNDISWYHLSGKHTTTYPEMIEIKDQTFVIDSPGIKGFGLTDINRNEIGLYFTDIFKLSKNCQFNNCTHIHEPNCAVIEAYQKGILHESRYRSYFNIFNDKDEKYRTG